MIFNSSLRKMIAYPVDIWPVTIVSVGLALSIFSIVSNITSAPLVLIAVLGVVLRILVPVHQHYHTHLPVFKIAFLNHLYDFILSIAGGHVSAMWKVHHGMSHHVLFLDPVKDLEGNDRFGKKNDGWDRLKFTFLTDLLSLTDCFKFLDKKNTQVRRKFKTLIVAQVAAQVLVYAVLLFYNWQLTIVILLIPNLFLRYSVPWFSYGQHDNLPMQTVYDASTTKFYKDWIGKVFLYSGLHTAHHEKPYMHWSNLPKRTHEILHLVPDVCLNVNRQTIHENNYYLQ